MTTPVRFSPSYRLDRGWKALACAVTSTATRWAQRAECGRRRLRRLAAVLVALVLAAGCTSRYATLLADRDVPEFAALLDAGAGLPRRVERVVACPGNGKTPPLRLAIEEVGTGEHDHVFVFLHGVASDRRVWRFVAGDLGRDNDLLLVDLPGCGGSDRPAPGSRGDDDYAPSALARCVLTALRDSARRRERPARYTLVGHSLGGSVILRMLGDAELRAAFADVRERVDGAILFAPADFGMSSPPDALRRIADVPAWKVQLGGALGLVRATVAEVCAGNAPDQRIPLKEEVDRTVEYLESRLEVTQAMLHQALPLRDDGTPDWDRAERLVGDYANVDVPCRIVWGERDATLPVAIGYKLAALLPDATLDVVPRSTHAVLCERPALCADLIRRFDAERRTAAQRAGTSPTLPLSATR